MKILVYIGEHYFNINNELFSNANNTKRIIYLE
jgi:hypothetical protein